MQQRLYIVSCEYKKEQMSKIMIKIFLGHNVLTDGT